MPDATAADVRVEIDLDPVKTAQAITGLMGPIIADLTAAVTAAMAAAYERGVAAGRAKE